MTCWDGNLGGFDKKMWDVAIFKKTRPTLICCHQSPAQVPIWLPTIHYWLIKSRRKERIWWTCALVMSPGSDSEIAAKWRFSLQCQHQEMSFKSIVQRTWLSTVTKRAWVMCTWQHATTNIILRSSMPCPVSNQMSLDCPGNLFMCLGSQNFAETYSNCSANLSGCVTIVYIIYLYLKISNACSFQMN